MTAIPQVNHSDPDLMEHDRTRYVASSKNLRIDPEAFTLSFRVVEAPHGKADWVVYELGEARIPPTPLWGNASKIKNHPYYFWTIAAAIDTYLLRQSETKSRHLIAIDCVNTLVKLIEYALIQGFYKLQDVPKEAWTKFALDLSFGGWGHVLEVERRAITEIAISGNPSKLINTASRSIGKWSVDTAFLDMLGTNIASVELKSIRHVLEQALESGELAEGGEVKAYRLTSRKKLKQSILTQYLRALNLLADVQEPWGLKFLPIPNITSFTRKNGVPNGRTKNFDPNTLARLLKHSYLWVLDYGPAAIEFLEAMFVRLADVYGPTAREDYGYREKPDRSWRLFQAKRSIEILHSLPERMVLERLLGKKINTWNKERKSGDSISVNGMLDELYSSCFCILAVMNARRKDELSHSSIGMYREGLRQIDAELKVYEFDFYVEKTHRSYIPFYINDISRSAIELLDAMSGLALGWAQTIDPKLELVGREDKLFNYPNVLHSRGGKLMWFAFNSVTQRGKAYGFVSSALESTGKKLRVSPHMFRRAYGTIFIYRYENSDLVALAQQYGHVDVKAALTYVTDGSTTEVGKSLAALWSAPREVIKEARQDHVDFLNQEVRAAGVDRLRDLVDEVVVKGVRYGGGFTRLINRFHSKLGTRIDYSQLTKRKQAEVLSGTILSRGHLTEPLRHASCMAGEMRRGAACSDKDGHPQRHIATAETCSGCPYSLIARGHLAALKEDEAKLIKATTSADTTIKSIQDQRSLKMLQRVITLQSKRLGIQ